jgi:hypothetical protein
VKSSSVRSRYSVRAFRERSLCGNQVGLMQAGLMVPSGERDPLYCAQPALAACRSISIGGRRWGDRFPSEQKGRVKWKSG